MRGEFNGPQKLIHDENPYMPSTFIVFPSTIVGGCFSVKMLLLY
jgi:hypothetical protein